jgi:DNA primase large subunit
MPMIRGIDKNLVFSIPTIHHAYPAVESRSCFPANFRFYFIMQTLERIEAEVKQLSKADRKVLRDWLENLIEDELEFTDEFKGKIERGERDLREGRVRVHKP